MIDASAVRHVSVFSWCVCQLLDEPESLRSLASPVEASASGMYDWKPLM